MTCCSSSTFDITAQRINLKVNFSGNSRPILWRLQENESTGALESVNMAGYTARLLAYSDEEMTVEVWNKTTSNGGLEIVTTASKIFSVNGILTTFANPYGVQVNVNDADASLVDDGLWYKQFVTPPVGDELPMMARGRITRG